MPTSTFNCSTGSHSAVLDAIKLQFLQLCLICGNRRRPRAATLCTSLQLLQLQSPQFVKASASAEHSGWQQAFSASLRVPEPYTQLTQCLARGTADVAMGTALVVMFGGGRLRGRRAGALLQGPPRGEEALAAQPSNCCGTISVP